WVEADAIGRCPCAKEKMEIAIEHEAIGTGGMLAGAVNCTLGRVIMHLGRRTNQLVLLGVDNAGGELNGEITAGFAEIDRPYAQREFIVKKSVRRERHLFLALGHSIPIGMPLIGKD